VSSRAGRRSAGFSLIEVLAVLVIFALMAGVVLPNFGIRGSRILDEESKRLASSLEFARTRAVMTGRTHRLILDLDRNTYQVESFGPPPAVEVEEAELAETAPPDALDDLAHPAMSPPVRDDLDYYPLVGTPGDVQRVDEEVIVEGVEYSAGTATEGVFQVVFERDGTAEWATLHLVNQAGRRVALHVEYLADSVTIERVAE
jgi:prepilin-type N-terminal cleavage/methylation domain-containing protein